MLFGAYRKQPQIWATGFLYIADMNLLLSPKTLALLGLAATNLFWAGNAVIARFFSNEIPPFTLSFYRWAFALLILLPFAIPYLKGTWPEVRRQWAVILVLGLLGISIFNTVLYLAAQSTTAVNLTLTGSSLPLVTLLFSWLILSDKPKGRQLFGVATSFIGIMVIISDGKFSQLLSLQFNMGDLLMLGAACCWSLYSVILRKHPVHIHPVALLSILMITGIPFISILFAIELYVLPTFTIDQSGWLAIVYTAIFPSILAYLFWGYGVKQLGPSVAALSYYLLPLFTAALAIPLLGEALYPYHMIGGLLILIGLYFGTRCTR
jgi:drug/metabolite transporter (DMT)-like permease